MFVQFRKPRRERKKKRTQHLTVPGMHTAEGEDDGEKLPIVSLVGVRDGVLEGREVTGDVVGFADVGVNDGEDVVGVLDGPAVVGCLLGRIVVGALEGATKGGLVGRLVISKQRKPESKSS